MRDTIVLDIETFIDAAAAARAGVDPVADGFLVWPLHQLACVSLFTIGRAPAREPVFRIETFSRAEMSERGIVASVEQALEGCFECVTFNGRGFDLPVLQLRAALTGERAPIIAQLNAQPRFRPGRHVDLLDEVTGFGAAPRIKLADLCAAFDIPVKLEAHGSDVATLVERQDWDSLSAYCQTDVVATWCALQAWRSGQRADPDIVIDSRMALAEWILANARTVPHLLPYARLSKAPGGGPTLDAAPATEFLF